jgi:hypothetical protein
MLSPEIVYEDIRQQLSALSLTLRATSHDNIGKAITWGDADEMVELIRSNGHPDLNR